MQLKTRLTDSTYITGLVLITISLICFCYIPLQSNQDLGIFFVNFSLLVFYLLILLFNGRLRKGRDGLSPLFLLLILFFISAWALNREMYVFEGATSWFVTLMAIICANYLPFSCWDSIPNWLKHIHLFIAGIAAIVFTYLSLYLIPLYGLSILASFVLGISLHTFVPLLFVLYTAKLIRLTTTPGSSLRACWWAGAGSAVVVVILFAVQWHLTVSKINEAYTQANNNSNKDLPAWITTAQLAPQGNMAQKILKTKLVYSVPEISMDNFLWREPGMRFGEEKKHDPLIMVAALFGGTSPLPEAEQIKVLEAMHDSRHQAQERIWEGTDLVTSTVNTNVHIWPRLHLAYTEKQLMITNNEPEGSWNDQEAIYTFHLPEGAVVTSLSLWIGNKEEKAILTTKQKADTAYKAIVGTEKRDPSVVHWQEGNTVSVRVFPVPGGGTRTFKIGITAPLQLHQQRLLYENIYFDGPAVANTKENININFDSAPKALRMPSWFDQLKTGAAIYKGSYQPNWQLTCTDEGLINNAFSFDSTTYSLLPYVPQRETGAIQNVYLDINKSWTKETFEAVYALTKEKAVYVCLNNELQAVTAANKNDLFAQLRTQQFSLFPVFKITDPATALLISQSTAASPSLDDLDGSLFKQHLHTYLSASDKIRLFNLGEALSPYLKSLKEFRVFRYEQGDMALLQELWGKKLFAVDPENNQRVVIDHAGMTISATPGAGTGTNTAPDHLMRLFSYNHILQQMGKGLLAGVSPTAPLVAEATKAYVVTPVSSLVVLETVQDYERFNITDSENSLKNASLKSKGAVPEPHEWALIILTVLTLLYVKFCPSFFKPRITQP